MFEDDLEQQVGIEKLEINGHAVDMDINGVFTENVAVEAGETLDVELKLLGLDDGDDEHTFEVKDIQVEIEVNGYEYGDLEDSSAMFDLEEGDSKWVDLSVTLPRDLETGDDLYSLRVKVTDQNSNELTRVVNLKVDNARHGLDIADVVFSPGTSVKAGQSLLTTVLVENFGGNDEEDVKVTVEFPELGLIAVDYIDLIKDGDKEHTGEDEEILRLPLCTEEGDYTARVTVEYNHGETVSKDFLIHVSASDRCSAGEDKLIITVGPESQNVVANQQAVYPIALTNAGTSAKTYVLELNTGEWAASSLSENLVVLAPGNTAVVYAYVTANDAATAGEKVATLTISSDDNVLKTIYLQANVVPQDSGLNLRSSLEVALVVLVAVLVLVGLILGFSRLRKDDVDEGEEKTYY
ncbi:hypothetical protein GOV03_02110 [Candidatus Woesearchaeota archaeon]|nr:hypothetical protein [Candidatus Woesearchaeota archaeon]